jgi:hypothetical protein
MNSGSRPYEPGRIFGVNGYIEQNVAIIDPRVQWGQAMNIWHNAAIRTGIYVDEPRTLGENMF